MSLIPPTDASHGIADPSLVPTLQIDREGFLVSDGVKLTDLEFGRAILDSISIAENGRYESKHRGVVYQIQSFDL
ncbi:MAG: hypothetical protein K2X47_10160, partial [Bdellovibrionales bacterium]|nr:hypothetical protein [Bdellovibrionales bacterium]